MNDRQRDPFDLGLDFRDAVRPAPPSPWQAQRVDVAVTAPPPQQGHPGAWRAPDPASWSRWEERTPSQSRPRHLDSEACGVVAMPIESQILIPTARPSYKAGFDRRELKALAAAAVTGLTIAGAMAATLLHTTAPTAAPAAPAAAAIVQAAPLAAEAEDIDDGPSLAAQLATTADQFAEAAEELRADATIDLDEGVDIELDEDEPDDGADEEATDDEPRRSVSSSPRSSSRSTSRRRAKKKRSAKKESREEKKAEKEPEEPKKVDGPLKDFNPNAARSALTRAAGAASGCGQAGGPTGRARVTVSFAPSGAVSSVSVAPPFAGTAVGRCIVGAFRGTTMTPFKGSPMSLPKSVFIRAPEGDEMTSKKTKSKRSRKSRRRR